MRKFSRCSDRKPMLVKHRRVSLALLLLALVPSLSMLCSETKAAQQPSATFDAFQSDCKGIDLLSASVFEKNDYANCLYELQSTQIEQLFEVDRLDGTSWTQPYLLQTWLTLFENLRDTVWLQRFVRHTNALLAARDNAIADQRSDYRGIAAPAWQQPDIKYVWAGFTGHVFTPIMAFTEMVLSSPEIAQISVDGTDLSVWANRYLAAFRAALLYHNSDLRANARGVEYAFADDMPTGAGNAYIALRETPLPVNMGATMFNATLHFANALKARGATANAERLLGLVQRYVDHLEDSVFKTTTYGGIIWNYNTLYQRVEDIGHSNVTVRFMSDASRSGLNVKPDTMNGLLATYEHLLDGDCLTSYPRITNISPPATQATDTAPERYSSENCTIDANIVTLQNAKWSHGSFYLPLLLEPGSPAIDYALAVARAKSDTSANALRYLAPLLPLFATRRTE